MKIKDCCLKRFVILNLIAKHRSNSKKPCRHHFRKQREIISNTGTCREWLWWLWLKFAKLEVCFSSTQVDIPNCRTHKRPVHLKFAFRDAAAETTIVGGHSFCEQNKWMKRKNSILESSFLPRHLTAHAPTEQQARYLCNGRAGA